MRSGWVSYTLPALLTLTLTGCEAQGERTGMTLFPDMMRSVPYDPYDPNPLTATGRTALAPPEGVVALGQYRFPYGVGEEEALRAAAEIENPLAPTSSNVARGQHIYNTFCIVCHGPGGEGDGPIIGRFPNPPSLLADKAKGHPDGRIFHILTRGQGIMASYAIQVRPDDRWRVIHYVRQLQGQLEIVAEAPGDAATEDPS